MSTDHLEFKASRSSDQEAFGRQGYLLLPALVKPALAEFFWSYVHTKVACRLLAFGGDERVPNSPSAYGDSAFDGLLEFLRPRIEEYSGLRRRLTQDCARYLDAVPMQLYRPISFPGHARRVTGESRYRRKHRSASWPKDVRPETKIGRTTQGTRPLICALRIGAHA
jgi:hypothetical protein